MLYYSDTVSTSSIHRHFYVNEGYYGCSGDLGWTLIVDGPGPCSMESLPTTAVYFVNTPSYSLMPGSKLSIGFPPKKCRYIYIYTTPTNLHHILIDKINFKNILIINLITSTFWINILLTFMKLIFLATADFMAVFVEKGKFVKK